LGSGTSGNLVVKTSNDTRILTGFQYVSGNATAPSIKSFTPTATDSGAVVKIIGSNFNGTISISIGNFVLDSFLILSNDTIQIVNGNERSGLIKVVTPFGVASSDFPLVNTSPVIYSVDPVVGPVGTTVTITGNNFIPDSQFNDVYFGSVKAQVITATDTSLIVIVPSGASYEPISVRSGYSYSFSHQPFDVTFSGSSAGMYSNSFAPKIDLWNGSIGYDISFKDLDGDGRPDIIANNHDSLLIFRNTSTIANISFTKINSYSIDLHNQYQQNYSVIGDFDADGRMDLATTRFQSSKVSLLRNLNTNGPVSFVSANYFTPTYVENIFLKDMDADGLPDIITGSPGNFTISKNFSSVGNISFAPIGVDQNFSLGTVLGINDFDGDGKPEIIALRGNNDSIFIFKNTSINTPAIQKISFGTGIGFSTSTANPTTVSIADLDDDGKMDIIIASVYSDTITILKNTSSNGVINFTPELNFVTKHYPQNTSIGDLDGDGKPDLIITSFSFDSISVYKNLTRNGVIGFASGINYAAGLKPWKAVAEDVDGDGKTDIAVVNSNGPAAISILRNEIQEPVILKLCPTSSGASIYSNLTGITYQWQIDTGKGFTNIPNGDSRFVGINTGILLLSNIQSADYGYHFRCVVDGNNSDIFMLKFITVWTGAINSIWENPGNWSCGKVPDSNTDVIINTGTVLLNSNVTVRSLSVSPSVSFTINPPYNLTVTH